MSLHNPTSYLNGGHPRTIIICMASKIVFFLALTVILQAVLMIFVLSSCVTSLSYGKIATYPFSPTTVPAASDRSQMHGRRSSTSANTAHVSLLILVMSSSTGDGKARRQTIRETWLSLINLHPTASSVMARFVIGTRELQQSIRDELYQESNVQKDMVLLPNLLDSYANLSLKVLESFLWASENLKFTFVMKCDDDSFINLPTFQEDIRKLEMGKQHERLYWGFFRGDAHVKTSGKWKEDRWFLCDRYLPYAHGGGYVLSSDLVKLLALNARYLTLYNSEDVSVGVWLAPYDITRKHDVRFDTEFVSRGCRNGYVVSHKQSIAQMQRKYLSLKTNGVLCEKEFQTRPSFTYNWELPPSSCCKRDINVI